MSQSNRQYELIVLGATGYTGKLVAEWVTTHLPEDLKWAIAGRNAKKLHAVVDDLKKLNPNRKQPGTYLVTITERLPLQFIPKVYQHENNLISPRRRNL